MRKTHHPCSTNTRAQWTQDCGWCSLVDAWCLLGDARVRGRWSGYLKNLSKKYFAKKYFIFNFYQYLLEKIFRFRHIEKSYVVSENVTTESMRSRGASQVSSKCYRTSSSLRRQTKSLENVKLQETMRISFKEKNKRERGGREGREARTAKREKGAKEQGTTFYTP